MPLHVRVHRWVGLVMVAPFIIWTVTGLLFHLKPGWSRAYDMLSERSAGEVAVEQMAPLPAGGAVSRLELFPSAIGPLYRVDRAGEVTLLDARTGTLRSPLDADAARAIAVDAVGRSPHRAAYGEPREVSVGDDEVVIRFSGGPVVSVDRRSARLSQHGGDTERIDWLYRVHYLQWTGVRSVDRMLSLLAIGGTWLVAGIGVWLFIARRTR